MTAKTVQKIVVLAVLAALVAAYFVFDFGQYLTLEFFKQSRADIMTSYESNKALFIIAYFVLYVLVAALSLPAATVITLVGGALFGLGLGTLIVSFASSIGATLACMASRFLLRDWVQGRLGARLASFNQGVEREGALYLFTLRLIPVFPFFAINLGMGLTPMRLFTFYWVSQLGMLPGTMVFVNAGTELGKIESLSGILSPSLIFSFALLGLFPLAAKKLLGWYKNKRATDGK